MRTVISNSEQWLFNIIFIAMLKNIAIFFVTIFTMIMSNNFNKILMLLLALIGTLVCLYRFARSNFFMAAKSFFKIVFHS